MRHQNLNIAMVVWHLTQVDLDHIGGLERRTITEAEALVDYGAKVSLTAPRFRGTPTKFAARAIPLLKFLGNKAPLAYYSQFVARNLSADIYHAQNSPFVAAVAPKKTLVHFGNEVQFPAYKKLKSRYQRAYYACVSDYVRRWLLDAYPDLPDDHVHVLHTGVDTCRFAPLPLEERVPGPLRFLFAGQWNEKKGLFTLLEAMHHLKPYQDQFELHLAGSAKLWRSKGDLQQAEAMEKKINEQIAHFQNICVIGPVSHHDMPALYRSVDVMIVPSIWNEPFANVILEATASGLPIIAFAVGGNPEVIVDSQTGCLVDDKTPKALAAAIAGLLDQADQIRSMGNAARQRAVEHFSWQKHMAQLWGLYQKVNPALPDIEL